MTQQRMPTGIDAGINPEILVWARETSGLSRDEAARKLGFQNSSKSSADQKLEALETGNKEPTRPQLLKMARQYRRPLLTFYLSNPPVKGDRGADFRTLSSDYSFKDDALLDALMRDIRARQSMVRAAMEDEEEGEPLAFVGSHMLEDGNEVVLKSLQKLLDVDLAAYRAQPDVSSAFSLLRGSAERAGIFVLLKGDLGNYLSTISVSVFRGFSIADEVAPFIVINDQDAVPAWSFTLLHEAVHLLLGQTGVSGEYGEAEVEKFCDGVAGDFLLPINELETLSANGNQSNSALAAGISDFAGQRKISHSMVAYKAFRAGQISRETCGELLALLRQQWRTERERTRSRAREEDSGPSFYTVRRHRLGNRITDLVRNMMAAETISTSKASIILGVKSRHVYPLLDLGRSQ